MQNSEKDLIIAAARQRFSYYGYSKTAMAEIAADCDMSVGNLYRFYKNKEDIAVEGARTCMVDKAEASELAARQADSPRAALQAFCLARLRFMHRFVSETPHMFELVELIAGKHKDVLLQFEDRACKQILAIIADGMESGAFRRCDAESVAMAIYNATSKYNIPLCMDAPLSQLETELGSLLDLIHAGLKAEKKS